MDLPENSCRLLLDVGGTFLKAVVADSSGELIPSSEFCLPMPSDGTREEITGALRAAVARGASFAAGHRSGLGGIALAFPGPFDYAGGIPRMGHKFGSIYGMSLVDFLHGLPCAGFDIPIRFMHDGIAALLGEMTRGNARHYDNVVLVSIGTGLGMACCLDRRVQYSPTGSPGITIYNMPYRDGILEDWVSKRGILRIHASIVGADEPSLTVADLGHRADCGDAAAKAAFAEAGRILAGAIRDLLSENNVQCLLMGGQISRSFVHLEPALRRGLGDVECLETIAPAANVGQAAFYGLSTQFNIKTEDKVSI
jgi:glucokinase